jgi:hypothetical protein
MARFTEERMFEKLGELTPSKKTRVSKTVCPQGYYFDDDKGECVKIEFLDCPSGVCHLPDSSGNIKYRNTLIKGYNYPKDTNAAQAWEVQKNQFPYAAEDADLWYNTWYAQRMAKPEFAQLAEQRLNSTVKGETPYVLEAQPTYQKEGHDGYATTYIKKVSNTANKPFENKIIVNGAIYPDSGNNDYYNSMMAKPSKQREYLFEELLHEKTHWDDNNYPQTGTSRHDIEKDEVLNSVLPKEYLIANPEGKIYHWDDNDNLLPFKFDEGLPEGQLEYLSRPTEVRARLNTWRQYNNISPTKDYHPSEIKRIIDSNVKKILNNPETVNPLDYRNILELYQIIHGDPKVLKELNDKYVSNDSDQELDLAQYGGQPKYPGGGEIELQGLKYRKDDSGKFFYLSGAPVTDTLLIQRLTYEGKPIGSSPAVTSLYPKPNLDFRTTDKKIADTKNKGMAYQSTANELAALEKQKAKEVADAKAEQDQLAQQSFERTVGADNTRVVPQVTPIEFKVETPWEQEASITKRYKEMARHIIQNGQHIAVGLDDEYLSAENSHRPGGPLSLEEIVIERLKKDPDFLMKDFAKREQKMYDQAPWYVKAINDVAAFAADPITTTERAVFDFERPLMFQALQSLNPDQFGGDSEFYNRALRRDENVLNNAFNYINPMRYGASAGLKAYDGDYLGAVGDVATGYLMGRALPGMAKGAGSAVTRIAKAPLLGLEGLPSYATYGNAANLYFGKHAITENLPNAIEQYSKGNIGEGNRELFYTALGVTPLAMEREALKNLSKDVLGLSKDVLGMNKFKPTKFSEPLSYNQIYYRDNLLPLIEQEAPGFVHEIVPAADAKLLKDSGIKYDKRVLAEKPTDVPLFTKATQQEAFDESFDFGKQWVLGENKSAYDALAAEQIELQKAKNYLAEKAYSDIVKNNDISDNVLQKYPIEMATAEDLWFEEQMQQIMSKNPTMEELAIAENELLSSKINNEAQLAIYDKALQLGGATPEFINEIKDLKQSLINRTNSFKEHADFIRAGEEKIIQDGLNKIPLDETFVSKVQKLYENAGAKMRSENVPVKDFIPNSGIADVNLNARNKLVHIAENDPMWKTLSESDKEYLLNNMQGISGVRRSSGSTITIGSKPGETLLVKSTPVNNGRVTGVEPTYQEIQVQDMIRPSSIGDTGIHEFGHDIQRLFPGSSATNETLGGWSDILQDVSEESRNLFQYDVPSDKNEVAKLFKEALVEPTPAVNGNFTYETWLSGPDELHSNLMIARKNIVDDLIKNHGETLESAVDLLKNNEDYYLDYILEHPKIQQHFKPEASVPLKKVVLKSLPMLIPAVGLGVAGSMDTQTLPENKYGGNIKNLSKFIRK